MKYTLKSLCFMLLLSWNVHVYASGNNFLDKLTDIEADILYGEEVAELPAEALALMAESSTFAEGKSILVFDEEAGHWAEISIYQANSTRIWCSLLAIVVPTINVSLIYGGRLVTPGLMGRGVAVLLNLALVNACITHSQTTLD